MQPVKGHSCYCTAVVISISWFPLKHNLNHSDQLDAAAKAPFVSVCTGPFGSRGNIHVKTKEFWWGFFYDRSGDKRLISFVQL